MPAKQTTTTSATAATATAATSSLQQVQVTWPVSQPGGSVRNESWTSSQAMTPHMPLCMCMRVCMGECVAEGVGWSRCAVAAIKLQQVCTEIRLVAINRSLRSLPVLESSIYTI